MIVILVSKAFAVAFLFVHSAFLHAPTAMWAAGAGDGAMLIALSGALARQSRIRAAG